MESLSDFLQNDGTRRRTRGPTRSDDIQRRGSYALAPQPPSSTAANKGYLFPLVLDCMARWSLRVDQIDVKMCDCFGAVAHGSAPTRSVGRWSNVLHAFAVSQSLTPWSASQGSIPCPSEGDKPCCKRQSTGERIESTLACKANVHAAVHDDGTF